MAIKGLSPRLRGNQIEFCWIPHIAGSIPAPAGEPPGWLRRTSNIRVYPRACGGTQELSIVDFLTTGLSPRLRGNLDRGEIELGPLGSIPAPAGEPPGIVPIPMMPRVYPRACGGTFGSLDALGLNRGLSQRWSGLFRQVEGEAKIVSDWFFALVEAVSSGMSGPPSTPSRQALESLAWGCRALRAGSGATGAQGSAPRNAGGQPAAIGR